MKNKSNKIESEKILVNLVINYLNKKGYRVRTEIPNLGQSADIVATRGRWVSIIEAKRSNWARAFEQCHAHESVADFIYIAISTKKVSKKFLESAKSKGYGIIHCDPVDYQIKIVLAPQSNKKIWDPLRKIFSNRLKSVSYAY